MTIGYATVLTSFLDYFATAVHHVEAFVHYMAVFANFWPNLVPLLTYRQGILETIDKMFLLNAFFQLLKVYGILSKTFLLIKAS